MKKKILLTTILAIALMAPVSAANANDDDERGGWPIFDVAKLASLVTNLVARFQSIPEMVTRSNQLETMMQQIKGVNQASVARELRIIGQEEAKALKQESYSIKKTKSPILAAAKGSNGARDASKKIKEVLFILNGESGKASVDEIKQVRQVRNALEHDLSSEVLARSLYMAVNAPKKAQERFLKADKAAQEAHTLQDSYDANTMMVMIGNYERLNQISLDLAEMRDTTFSQIKGVSITGYEEPVPYGSEKKEAAKMGKSVFIEKVKEKANVNFK